LFACGLGKRECYLNANRQGDQTNWVTSNDNRQGSSRQKGWQVVRWQERVKAIGCRFQQHFGSFEAFAYQEGNIIAAS